MRESLGILQFGIAVIAQCIAAAGFVLSQIIVHSARQHEVPDLKAVFADVTISLNVIVDGWLLSLLVFMANIALSIRFKPR